ncbi:MAG: hypothetical protein WD737_02565 [Gemmatimonadota bacterium]
MKNGYQRWLGLGAAILLIATGGACSGSDSSDWELPDPEAATEWYGEDVDARLDGNVLEIRGTMNPYHLARGGRIWARGGPYFYLFNVHVQQLLEDYPDLAAVRAVTVDSRGSEVARATLVRSQLSEVRWNQALARASLAQREGSERPRLIEELIAFGEDHTEYSYQQ